MVNSQQFESKLTKGTDKTRQLGQHSQTNIGEHFPVHAGNNTTLKPKLPLWRKYAMFL